MSAASGKFPRFALLAAVLMFGSLTFGCQAKIGDPCQTLADCTTGSDRICDVTQPGGYCTIFNCEPDTCPEESSCVAFRTSPAAAVECRSSQESPRLQRSFCMRHCNRDADCRAGYACIGFSNPNPRLNPWSAEVIDSVSAGVCMVPYSGPDFSVQHETDVCTAPPAVVSPPAASPTGVTDAAGVSDAALPGANNSGDAGDGG